MDSDFESKLLQMIECKLDVLEKKIEEYIDKKLVELAITKNSTDEGVLLTKVSKSPIKVEDDDMTSNVEISQTDKELISSETSELQRKISNLPPKMKIRDVEKYVNDIKGQKSKFEGEKFSKRKFLYYLDQGVIQKPIKTSKNQSLYAEEHLLMYLVLDSLPKTFQIDRIKGFYNLLQPLIKLEGYSAVSQFILLIDKAFERMSPRIVDNIVSQNLGEEVNYQFTSVKEYYLKLTTIQILKSFSNEFVNVFDSIVKQYDIDGDMRAQLESDIKSEKPILEMED